MVRKHLDVIREAVGVERLDRRADRPMEVFPLTQQQRIVCDLVRQRVAEKIGHVGIDALLVNQLETHQLAYR